MLSAAQVGRLVLVLPRVDNAIRRQIGRVMRGQAMGKQQRRGQRARRGMSPDLEDPYAGDDDGVDPMAPPRRTPAATRKRQPELQHPF